MKIVADSVIPFLKGVFEPYADVVYKDGKDISADDLVDEKTEFALVFGDTAAKRRQGDVRRRKAVIEVVAEGALGAALREILVRGGDDPAAETQLPVASDGREEPLLQHLQQLDLQDSRIKDYTALEQLSGLVWLNLSCTSFSDTGLLSGMKDMETLILCGSQVRDLTPLLQLKHLQLLDISGLEIRHDQTYEELSDRLGDGLYEETQ